MTIYEDQIDEEGSFCPYCGDGPKVYSDSSWGCCGESECHYERGYLVEDEWVMESECTVVTRLPVGASNAPG